MITARDTSHLDSMEVTRRAVEVFGDSVVTVARAADSATNEPSWDIEVRSYQTTARVEHYVRMFSGPAKERIQSRLQKGTRYEPMIRAKMRAGGIPEDMYYLALVESGFDPSAYSRAAAVGMWQFMTSTARDMGMRVDWWIDERADRDHAWTFRLRPAAVPFLRFGNRQWSIRIRLEPVPSRHNTENRQRFASVSGRRRFGRLHSVGRRGPRPGLAKGRRP